MKRAAIRSGVRVKILRWHLTPDGYVPEVVVGYWWKATDRDWMLLCGDEVARFPRAEWELIA